MKLIECYVENFGKLSAYRLKFKDGLNAFVQENGYGKTTLTEFIKAMLYGLGDTKKGDILENDRRRYTPWGGGVCGGWLSFSEGGKGYRIERTFGQKAQDDTFALYDLTLGKPTDDYSENIGRELFGIDKEGFLRTVFLSEQNLSGKNDNKSISEKLSDTTGVDYDMGAMDEAIKLLEDRRKFYYKRGGSGEISSVEADIRHAESELSRFDALRDDTAKLRERMTQINEQMNELAKQRAVAERHAEQISRENEKRILRDHYKKLSIENAQKKERLATLNAFFKNGVPTAEQIRDAQMSKIRSSDLYRNAESTLKNEKLDKLKALFDGVKREDIDEALQALAPQRKSAATQLPALLVLAFSVLGAVVLFIKPIISIFAFAAAFVALLPIIVVKTRTKKPKLAENAEKLILEFGVERSSVGLQRIYSELAAYELLLADEQKKNDYREKALKEAAELADLSERFLRLYPTVSDHPFEEINALLVERESIIRILSEFSEDIEKYAAEAEPQARTDVVQISLSDVIEQQSRLESERAQLQRRISLAEDELLREEEVYNAYDESKSKLEAYRHNLFCIQKAAAHLEAARDAMTARYLTKTKAAFEKYASLIGGDDGEYIMDTSFEISKSEHGAARKSDHYSLGTRNTHYLATRLALIDALYESATPFLILDDPFISFDDARAKRALSVLKKLSAHRQIIYFTCSESRTI